MEKKEIKKTTKKVVEKKAPVVPKEFEAIAKEFEKVFEENQIRVPDWKAIAFLKEHNFSNDEIVFLAKYCSAPEHNRLLGIDGNIIDIRFNLYHHGEQFKFTDFVKDNFNIFKKYVACILNDNYGGCRNYKIDSAAVSEYGELVYNMSAKTAA